MGAREASDCPSGSVGHPPLFEVEAGHVLSDGMVVSQVISTITRANEQSNQKYLEAKQDRVKRLLASVDKLAFCMYQNQACGSANTQLISEPQRWLNRHISPLQGIFVRLANSYRLSHIERSISFFEGTNTLTGVLRSCFHGLERGASCGRPSQRRHGTTPAGSHPQLRHISRSPPGRNIANEST